MKGYAMSVPSKRPTVLVVDDEPFNLSLMDEILNRDYEIRKASNGPDALKLAFANPPDLILIDVMMPSMDGFEVCRQLKNNAAIMHVPVIFITAKNEIKDEELGFSVGASDFIHKPISAPIVAARVRTHLKIKMMQDYLRNENSKLLKDAGEKSVEMQQLRDFMWGQTDKFAKR
jgi:putative two-component system response regulator